MKKKVLVGLVCAFALCMSFVLVGCGGGKSLDKEVSLPHNRISFSIPSDWKSSTTNPLPVAAICNNENDDQSIVVVLDWQSSPEEFLNNAGRKLEKSGSIDSVGEYQVISYKAKNNKTNEDVDAHAIFIDGNPDYEIFVVGSDINIDDFIKTIK